MAQPTEYERVFSFTDFTETNPDDQQPGEQLDAEFNQIKITLDEILFNLMHIQRDDLELANQTVGLDQLKAAILVMWDLASVWTDTPAEYGLNDTGDYDRVIYRNAIYAATTDFTSDSDFDVDLTAGRWELIFDGSGTAFTSMSSTSVNLATVAGTTKTLTVTAGKDFPVGGTILAASAANPTVDYFVGQIVSYVGTALQVAVPVGGAFGTGTHTDWVVSLTGQMGVDGPQGIQGDPGADGADGAAGSNGTGLPAGGATNEIPYKISGTDYDIGWIGLQALADLIALTVAGAGGGGGGGLVSQYEIDVYNATTTLTGSIPKDNTVPQDNEGVEIMSVTITPADATNIIRVSANLFGNNGRDITAAVFQSESADAIGSTILGTYDNEGSILVEFVAATTDPITITCRVGRSGSPGTFFLNKGTSSGVTLGGTLGCTLIAEEMDIAGATSGGADFQLLHAGSIDTAVASGLLDLRSYVTNDEFTVLTLELENIVSVGAGASDSLLKMAYVQQGAINSVGNYVSALSAAADAGVEFSGNLNQAVPKILQNAGSSVNFAGGYGTIELRGFCNTVLKMPVCASTKLYGYFSNGTITNEVGRFCPNEIIGSGGDDTKVTDGVAFSCTNATNWTFNYKLYGKKKS